MEKILVYSPGLDFVRPYICRETGVKILYDLDSDIESVGDLKAVIMLSSWSVFGNSILVEAYENDVPDKNSEQWHAEERFHEFCRAKGLHGIVLRCPDVIGTGMNGFPGSLAADIWRGTFFHFPGNEARRSAVHAAELAVAVRLAVDNFAGKDVVFHISDMSNPKIHDLAEALAFRMKNKRISNLSTRPQQWLGRLIYGKSKYLTYTTSQTLSGKAFIEATGWTPTGVCQYMRSHNYDENSL